MSNIIVARDFIVHITALCPFCRSAYQVQETLRGQLVRCPNPNCKQIFPVPVEPPPPEAPATPPQPRPRPSPAGGQRSGTVGDLVPILPAEQAAPVGSGTAAKHVSEMVPVVPAAPATEGQRADGDWWQAAPPVRDPSAPPPSRSPATPSAPPAAAEATWWQNAPPPVRNPQQPAEQPPATEPPRRRRPPARSTGQTQPIRPADRPAAQTQQIPSLAPEQRGQPRELPPGMWEPPPVRRGTAGNESQAQTEEATTPSETHQPRLSKRHAWFGIIGFSAFALVVVGSVGSWALWKYHHSEGSLSEKADEFYGQGSFSNAAEKFQELHQKFPNSDSAPKYRFMAEWSNISSVVKESEDVHAAIGGLDEFIKHHKDDPLMKERARDAGQRLLNLTATFTARNKNPPDEEPLKDAERIEQLRRMVSALDGAALTREESAQIDTDLGQVRKAVETARKRRAVLAQLRKKKGETWMEAIKRARALVASMERELPDLAKDAEVQTAIAQLYDGHLDSVKYYPRKDAPTPPPHPPEDDAESLLFAPLLPTASPGNAPPNDPIVLALVRGILYALKQSNGELKWATRVGVDTTVLPQRVPESAINPELLLVLSADTHTLSALDVKGDLQWEYHVGQPVLGKPIIIDQRAYLADYTGWVHEIELSRGQLLGRWDLGQPLTRGGAREGDTSLLYFPADDSCIYVLDVNSDPKKRRCVTILYDGHPSGSLRSEPIIIPPVGDNSPGFLILNQTNDLDRMQLQVFELPLQDRFAPPLTLDPPARLLGWTWFEPKEDGEKMSVLTDAGILGLFGIKQVGNHDPALFPLLQQGGLDLSPFLPNHKALPRERGRSQVVHMRSEDLWVLARGQFQQLKLGMVWYKGPLATSCWEKPLNLGSPLHEPQRIEDRNTGHSTFVLVTQALEQQTCLASRVDDQGKIVWQRQLGLVCQGEPLALTPADGGLPLLVALDQGGGLFALDPSVAEDKINSCWSALAAALAENPLVPPRLLPAADGRSAYEVAAPGDGHNLIVRHIEWAGKRELNFTEHKFSLLGPGGKGVLTPAGLPIVQGSQLLMPMNDGLIKRMSLDSDKSETVLTWRASGASVAATCSLLALPGDRFLTTDGSRGLTVYEWRSNAGQWQKLSFRQLEQLVAAPPVLIPAAAGQQPDVAVADSAGVLHLFTVQPDGSLQPKPGLRWELEGNLTAGPFVLAEPKGGWRIGCVLDRQRLLWLDPSKKEPLWTYDTGGPAILGHPRWIEDMLVTALQSGQYVGIEPLKGQPFGRGYTLRTSAAPAATPMPFGPGRMFTPLTDGTALLLSCDRLRTPAKK